MYFKQKKKFPEFLRKYDLSETINKIINKDSARDSNQTVVSQHEHAKVQNDMILQEVEMLLDTTKDLKIKQKYIQNIPEDKLEQELQNILLKFMTRRLSSFIGQGALSFGIQQTIITEQLKILKINLSAIMPNDTRVL
jgi:hypothetical protein